MAQVVERGYAVCEVAERLGISTKSLYTWKAQFAKSPHNTGIESVVQAAIKEEFFNKIRPIHLCLIGPCRPSSEAIFSPVTVATTLENPRLSIRY